MEIAEKLAELHKQGRVHGAVTPENAIEANTIAINSINSSPSGRENTLVGRKPTMICFSYGAVWDICFVIEML